MVRISVLPNIGNVILLPPIMGDFTIEVAQMNFIQPRAEKLRQLAEAGTLPITKQCPIHVEADDWQSNLTNLTALGALLGLEVTVVPKAEHMLLNAYVGDLLDMWLLKANSLEMNSI
jgi:hypothetical protein